MATFRQKYEQREAQFLTDWNASDQTQGKYDTLQAEFLDDIDALRVEYARSHNESDPPGHPRRPT